MKGLAQKKVMTELDRIAATNATMTRKTTFLTR